MSKRHSHCEDFSSRVRRVQELIMSHSGVDEFQETLKIILVKWLAEDSGASTLPSLDESNSLLAHNVDLATSVVDGPPIISLRPDMYDAVRNVLSGTLIGSQDFAVLDAAFEELTSRRYKSDKGQYFTPRYVVAACVAALDVKPTDLVCDPACGSGAFLMAAYRESITNFGVAPALYGFDYSRRACQVARLLSLIATDGAISIRQLDSLKLPEQRSLLGNLDTIEGSMPDEFPGFDVIATNPPFAGDVSEDSTLRSYDIIRGGGRRIERDVLFIERCIRLLRVGGRLAIVLPDNKVSGRAFAYVREWLLRHSQVCAALSLHRYTFLPHTTQKTAVLFAKKMPPSLSMYDSEITFMRSDKPGKTSNGSLVFRDDRSSGLIKPGAVDHDLDDVPQIVREARCW